MSASFLLKKYTAEAIHALAAKTGGALDMIASRTWLTESVNLVLTAATRRSLGDWATAGLDKLADELHASSLTGRPMEWWVGVLDWPSHSVAVSQMERAMAAQLTPNDPTWTEVTGLRGEEYALWAITQARRLGVSVTRFLRVRREMGIR